MDMKYPDDAQDNKEYNKDGDVEKGGGYYMSKAGKLCKMEKSMLDVDDLQKSLDKLAEFAKSTDGVSRKEELLEKASRDELCTEERQELFSLLGGEQSEPTATLGEELTKSMDQNQGMQDALDVSVYLNEQHKELKKSLHTMAGELEKSDARRHEFSLVLAKAVSDIGSLMKSIDNRLGVIEGQPARAPKSQGVRPLQKSFAGDTPREELTKSQILDGLDGLMAESMQKGMDGRTVDGEDITLATAKFEQTAKVSPSMYKRITEYNAR
jgi:hypothetical protein